MDALALLCNLYGDGPATLARLRVQGILCIEDLEQRGAKDLAGMLAMPASGARRFLKEASALRERVLDSAASRVPAKVPASSKPPERELLRGKQAMLEAAARRWSELEQSEPEPRGVEPRPQVSTRSAGTPLSGDGLGRALCEALESAGVTTLEALLERDGESLAGEARVGLSQVLFAQGLARRRLREGAQRTVVTTPAPGPGACAAVAVLGTRPAEHDGLAIHVLEPAARARTRFSPSERPPREWLSAAGAAGHASVPDEGAGPFA